MKEEKKCVSCKRKTGKIRDLRFVKYQLNSMDIILCDKCYEKIKYDWIDHKKKNSSESQIGV